MMQMMMQMMFEYLDDVHVVLCDNTGDYDNNKGGIPKVEERRHMTKANQILCRLDLA